MRKIRRGFVVGACVAALLLGASIFASRAANAEWEELPGPPITMRPGSFWFSNDEWMMPTYAMGYGNCWPFLVPDDDNFIYMVHASNSFDYDIFFKYDTVSEVYSNLASPANTIGVSSDCVYSGASGTYVDGRIFVNIDEAEKFAEYDVVQNEWSFSAIEQVNGYFMPALASDENHEKLIWFDTNMRLYSADPESGPLVVEEGVIPYDRRWSTGLTVFDNRVYVAGGFFIGTAKGFPVPWGWSSQLSTIFDLDANEVVDMSDVPNRTAVVGVGVGGDGIHYIGSQMTAPGMGGLGAILLYYSVKATEIYHYVYSPEVDEWWTFVDDLPPDCLPLSAAEQGGWLYGLFSCLTPNSHHPRLFRTQIDNLTCPPPVDDDSSDDDVMDDDSADDDTSDDDTVDDDSTGDDTVDDDAGDDDTTSPNADASPDVDEDDDDDGCGW